jgi:hypothetical protein
MSAGQYGTPAIENGLGTGGSVRRLEAVQSNGCDGRWRWGARSVRKTGAGVIAARLK